MRYLSSFTFPSEDAEWNYRVFGVKRTCYSTLYPFYVLPKAGLHEVTFAPITIFYGGNGCGKSTALNVIAEKLALKRDARFNRSSFFDEYVRMCSYSTEEPVPRDSAIITSDDVFDFMLNLRALNDGVDQKREALLDEYYALRDSSVREPFRLKSMDDYDQLKKVVSARKSTQSEFVRRNLPGNAQTHSNGESADIYFKSRIRDDTLCLLDEPENSLSPEKQIELSQYLAESARYCGCQLVISTHSPFLLAIDGAKIYNLDDHSRTAESWTALPNVRAYYDFFMKHKSEFDVPNNFRNED